MFYKLLCFTIDGPMYSMIKKIYSNSKCCINLRGHFTDWFPINYGVMQGDILSPTIFNMYINNLVVEVDRLNKGVPIGDRKVGILAYADDIVLIAENENDLQSMLSQICDWCRRWHMAINCNKTKILHFRNKRNIKTKFNFQIGENAIEIENKYKYLGVVFNEFLDYNMTDLAFAQAGGRALGSIINKFKALKDMGYKTYSKLWDTCVTSVLDYGVGVWGLQIKRSESDKVLQRAMKFYLGVHKNTTNAAVIADMGWKCTDQRTQLESLRLWNRLINMPNSRLCKHVFLWDRHLNVTSWSSRIEQLFEMLNMSDVYDSMMYCDLKLADKKMWQHQIHLWKETVSNKPKLGTYSIFKHTIEPEFYVKYMPRAKRSTLAQLRFGVLPLKVETARFRRPVLPLNERICGMCTLSKIEDEKHFVFECSLYNEERIPWFNEICKLHSNFPSLHDDQKISIVMSNFLQKITANFIYQSSYKRKGVLYK